jgi:hypothetical protein
MTAALTPSGCDLTDFAFMPLDVARLRDSELASNETPEACWAAVLLWAASWHQVPAASIPNDEKWIAKQAGYAQRGKIDRAWADVRDGALRGFVECDDGRLYHPVVAEKACEAWKSKLAHRWRTECARIKKHNERHHTSIEKLEFEAWLSAGCPQGQPLYVPSDSGPSPEIVDGETASKGQGEREGQGQGQGDSGSEAKASGTAGAAPAVDKSETEGNAERRRLWRQGGSLLVESGIEEREARSLLGRLAKDFPVVIRDAVDAAIKATPADPASYLVSTCQRMARERNQAVTVPGETTQAYLVRVAMEAAAEAERKLATPEEIAAIKAQRAGVTA